MNAVGPAVARAVRVIVCDDSLVIRAAVARMLRAETLIEIVATVANGQAALDALRAARERGAPVDVVVLDIEMPVMDGMTALPLMLEIDPTLRVLMSSTLTRRGAEITMEALRRGAADYVPKPSADGVRGDESFRAELVAKVLGLGRLATRRRAADRGAVRPSLSPVEYRPLPAACGRPALLAIGSSTGGPQALFALFRSLGPALGVPVVITQHMPTAFVPMLADHLSRLGTLPCHVAEDGAALRPNQALIAPGDRHLVIERGPAGHKVRLSDAAPENFCRPAVDVMLRSASSALDGRVLVVMLTGMGRDGLEGTREIVAAGGLALAQDEATSVVWGMPGAIARAGLAQAVMPVEGLATTVRQILEVS